MCHVTLGGASETSGGIPQETDSKREQLVCGWAFEPPWSVQSSWLLSLSWFSKGQHWQCPPEARHPGTCRHKVYTGKAEGEHQYLSPGLEKKGLNTIWCQSRKRREKQKTLLEHPIPKGRGLSLILDSNSLWLCVHVHMNARETLHGHYEQWHLSRSIITFSV